MLRALLCTALLIALSPSTRADEAVVDIDCGDAGSIAGMPASRCMTVQVPLHHAAADGDSISLFVRRFAVAPGVTRRGEVWLLAGGPGEAGNSLYPTIATYQRAFPGFELVIPDHRGTGRSARICPQQEAADSPGGTGVAGEEWGPCIGAMYADVARTSAFSITEAAQDLQVLMASQPNQGQRLLYGVSYGTQLALRALQVSPLPVDALVLDGLVPPEATTQWDLSRRTALVDAVGRRVLGVEGIATYRRVLAGSGSATWRSEVPGADLRRFFAALLNFPELRDRIPQLVQDLDRGDADLLQATVVDWKQALAALGQNGDDQPALPLVMLIAASENNARPELSQQTVDAEMADALFVSPIPGLLLNSSVPAYAKDAWFGRSPAVLPRTLIVHGTLDPNTAYAGALEHAATLSKAGPVSFHTVERGAHLLPLVAPACFVSAVQTFVDGGPVPARCATTASTALAE